MIGGLARRTGHAWRLSLTEDLKLEMPRNDAEDAAVLSCPRCGHENPHRLEREGFLQKHIYSLFGFYPWTCNRCRATFFLKRRYRGRRKSETEYPKKRK